jgi:hypothetical protein
VAAAAPHQRVVIDLEALTPDPGETAYIFQFRKKVLATLIEKKEYKYRQDLDALVRSFINVVCQGMSYSDEVMAEVKDIQERFGLLPPQDETPTLEEA